jgi:hypothetical protein
MSMQDHYGITNWEHFYKIIKVTLDDLAKVFFYFGILSYAFLSTSFCTFLMDGWY